MRKFGFILFCSALLILFLSGCASERRMRVTWNDRTIEVYETGVLLGTWKSSAAMTSDTLRVNDQRDKSNISDLANIAAGAAIGLAGGLAVGP